MHVCRFFLIVFFILWGNSKAFSAPGEEARVFNSVNETCLHSRQRNDECSFYSQCLEASIQCENTDFGYAIRYGEKYCHRFSEVSSKMSDRGKAWLNATRYCLQEAIPLTTGAINSWQYWGVPQGNKATVMSCSFVRRTEFDIHPSCYLGGPAKFSGARHESICSLSYNDILGVFEAAELVDTLNKEGVTQMSRVFVECVAYVGRKIGIGSALTFDPSTAVSNAFSAALLASSEDQKLYDLWVWKQASYQNYQAKRPAPPPPASIAADLPPMEPEEPSQTKYKVLLKTRAGYYLSSLDATGKVSAVPNASRNPAISDEIFTLYILDQPSAPRHFYTGMHFILMTRSGYYLNSLDSKGPLSAQNTASFNPTVSDEVFKFGYTSASGIDSGSHVLIKTRSGYYWSSYDSRGDVTAIPSANTQWGISDELFEIEIL